jgi:hypothetical protein
MKQAIFDRMFSHFEALEAQRDYSFQGLPRRAASPTDLSAYTPPNSYGPAPTPEPETVARLTALAEEHAAFATFRIAQPKPITDLAAFVAPDAWGQR